MEYSATVCHPICRASVAPGYTAQSEVLTGSCQQKYHTVFHIKRSVACTPLGRQCTSNVNIRRVMIMAEIVSDAFVRDVKALVAAALKSETVDILNDPTHELYDWARRRKAAHKSWASSLSPLNFGPGMATLGELVRVISRTPEDIAQALPHSNINHSSVESFVDRLLTWAVSNWKPRAPLSKTGSCGVVLRTIIQETDRYLQAYTVAERKLELKKALVTSFVSGEVHFIPDALPNPAGYGSPSHQPSIHAWTVLGDAPDARSLNPSQARSHDERVTLQLAESSRALAQADVRAPWYIERVLIQHISKNSARLVLPMDWSIEEARRSATGFVLVAYNYAQSRFEEDIQHWTCQLAITLAIMLSKSIPFLFFAKNQPQSILSLIASQQPTNSANCIKAFRSVPWTALPGPAKGLSNMPLYLTQVAVCLLAWIDENSPLRIGLANKTLTGQLSIWNSKHGTPFTLTFIPFGFS